MINYFNFQKRNNKYLISNDLGKYQFVSEKTFQQLIDNVIPDDENEKNTLKENGFIYEGTLESFVKNNIPWLHSMKNYCMCSTALHIFAVTNKCNLDCVYCQAHSKSSCLDRSMTKETGRKVIEFALQSPNRGLTFEFQGGEPLLNFEVIKDMITYSKQINDKKHIEYTIVTNLLDMTEDKLRFLVENDVHICTSLDGPDIVHNNNRPCKNGSESYSLVMAKIKHLKSKGIPVNAIQTTSKFSLQYPKEIIDQYRTLEINNIFLRPLTPLGMADSSWENIG